MCLTKNHLHRPQIDGRRSVQIRLMWDKTCISCNQVTWKPGNSCNSKPVFDFCKFYRTSICDFWAFSETPMFSGYISCNQVTWKPVNSTIGNYKPVFAFYKMCKSCDTYIFYSLQSVKCQCYITLQYFVILLLCDCCMQWTHGSLSIALAAPILALAATKI